MKRIVLFSAAAVFFFFVFALQQLSFISNLRNWIRLILFQQACFPSLCLHSENKSVKKKKKKGGRYHQPCSLALKHTSRRKTDQINFHLHHLLTPSWNPDPTLFSIIYTCYQAYCVFVQDVGRINITFDLFLSLCSSVKQESVMNKAWKQELQNVNTEFWRQRLKRVHIVFQVKMKNV